MFTVRMAYNTFEGFAVSYFLYKSIVRSKVQIFGTSLTISYRNAKVDVPVQAASMRRPVGREHFALRKAFDKFICVVGGLLIIGRLNSRDSQRKQLSCYIEERERLTRNS